MIKKLFIIIFIALVPCMGFAIPGWYNATTHTGSTASSLDSIEGETLSDGDKAIVAKVSGQTDIYNLDADSALDEDSTNFSVISPDSNAGDKRWVRVWSGGRVLIPDSTVDQGDSTVTGTLAWHIDNASSNPTTVRVLTGTYKITTDITIPATMNLELEKGALLKPDAAKTITVNSPEHIIASPRQQIIDSTNNSTNPVLFSNSGVVYVPWWDSDAGDGSTECSNIFQMAINSVASHASTAMVISVPSGDYILTSGLDVNSNVHLKGEGESTYLDFTGLGVAVDAIQFDTAGSAVDDFVIADMRIVGPGGDWDDGGSGVRINSSHHERIIVRNMRIEQFTHGIRMDGQTTGESPWIINNWIDKNSYTGIYLIDTQNAYVAGNHIDGIRTGVGDEVSGKVGIWETIESGGSGNLNNRIIGNTVKNTSTEAILIRGKYTSVVGNTVHDGVRGISVEPFSNDTPTEADGEMHASVVGNTITAMTGYAIYLGTDTANITQGVSDCTVSSNTITDCGTTWSIAIGGSTETPIGKNNTVVGNVISDGYGGIFAQKTENLQLTGNVISDVEAYGIRLNTVTGATILGGSVNTTGADPGDGLSIKACTDVSINGVRVLDVDAVGINIHDTSSGVTVFGCEILDQKDTPTMTYGIFGVVTNTGIIHYNNRIEGHQTAAVSGVNETTTAPALTLFGPSVLNGSVNGVDATLADGQEVGATKTIVLEDATNQPHTVTIAHHVDGADEVATFDALDETLVLVWTGTEWATIYATCTF